jgi:predicted ribosome quality control (RQC) complex YloA/Tae2 family protein
VKLAVRRGEESTILWLRLWGAASNIIAAEEDGTVLDAFFRRPKKGEVTGGFYKPESPRPDTPAAGGGPGIPRTFEVRPRPEGTSFNAFIEEEYGRKEEEGLRKRLLDQLESRRRTREAKLHSVLGDLRKRREEYRNLELFRKYGDLVMANLHTLKKGDGWLTASDYEEKGREINIEIDSKLSPHENAEIFYRKYKKAKSGLDILEEEIRNLEGALRQMESRREKLAEESDIGVLEEELRRDKPVKIKEKEKTAPPGLQFFSGGFTILVGRTAAENDELLRRHVRGNDVWLHTRDCPGGYIFIKTRPGKSVPLETLLDAGNLAVFYSKARSAGSAELYYTQVKHLRRAKGGKLGTVLPTHEKNLSVKVDPARLERLDGQV